MKRICISIVLAASAWLAPVLSHAKVVIEVQSAPAPSARPYGDVRGFNFQPPWGSNGRDIWGDRFDATEYRRIVRLAKKAFPKMNCLRVWLSFDAWYDGRETVTSNMVQAATIIADEGLKMIPVYFNGWHSTPDFGGFTYDQLAGISGRDWQPYRRYLAETAAALERTGAVLISDLCNEPLHNALGQENAVRQILDFLTAMSTEIRMHSKRPVTISSEGYRFGTRLCGAAGDMELFAGIVDVLSVHPYSVCMAPKEGHLAHVQGLVADADRLGKPIIVTECCWDADTDSARGDIIALELGNYGKVGIGFLVHALCPSKVADLHPKDGVNPGFDMHFMELNGDIRPHHDAFNRY